VLFIEKGDIARCDIDLPSMIMAKLLFLLLRENYFWV
jgi:hypothetical protein